MKTEYKIKRGTIKLNNAHFCKSGNIKLGAKVWTLSKLFGRFFYKVEDMHGNSIEITGSCGDFCESCGNVGPNGELPPCYVAKSYRYTSVVKAHAENSQAFRDDLDAAFARLDKQIERAKEKPVQVRINQSGEIESKAEFDHWVELAKKYPNIEFWLYTKAFEYINSSLDAADAAGNITVNISIWGPYGLDFFQAVKKHHCIAAFVYIDSTYTVNWYHDHGLIIKAWCRAYDKNGKLDHSITCDTCKLCTRGNGLVIGCYDH